MASIVTSNQQDIEDQYFDRFGQPMIFCKSHQNKVYEFINTHNLTDNKLVCPKCVIKDNLDHKFLISVDEIFTKNPSNIIQNWPPLENISIYQHLMTKDVQESMNIQSIEQINNYFDMLKVDILKTIEDHQKKILAHINRIEENRQKVIDLYNEISSKDEIKNEFLKNKNNLEQLQQYLKQIISTKYTQSQHNQLNINKALDIFSKSQQQFELEYIQNLYKQFLLDLKSIDVLNPLLTIEQQLLSRISDENNNQDEQNKLSSKVDKIMNLINNKSNFCSPKFLENMKDILMMNKQIFTLIDINNPYIEENQPIQFEYLQQNQLQQLSYAVKCLNNWNINKKSNVKLQEYIWKNQVFEQYLMTIQYLFKETNEKYINEEIKQKIVQNSENIEKKVQNQSKIDVSEIDLLQQLKILKSNYGKQDLISFKRIENNYFLIERSNTQGWSQVVIDEELIPEKKYQIEIEIVFNSFLNYNEIFLGLLPISQKDESGKDSKLSLYLNGSGQGIDKIVCGKHISKILKDNKQIAINFQICLKEEILRCLSVVNNEKNINCLDD